MKKIFLLATLLFFAAGVFAQAQNDSLAYQLQRKKINSMLAVRKEKFGSYDESLSMHTGIFGLQTKKDIRRSNDILMDIVNTDNDIYKELKILLDYRAFQQTQILTSSKETQQTNTAFMNTINRFRQKNDELKAELKEQAAEQEKTQRMHVIIFVFMLASILVLLFLKRKVKV